MNISLQGERYRKKLYNINDESLKTAYHALNVLEYAENTYYNLRILCGE